MHANSFHCFLKHAVPYLKGCKTTLEISPGHGNRKFLAEIRRLGVELNDHWIANLWLTVGENVIPMVGEHAFACEDSKFDAIWSTNVIEHVYEPWTWMIDQARILKSGGVIIHVGPVTWPEHRVSPSQGRRDCWRILPDGMKTLHRCAGLKTELALLVQMDMDNDQDISANRGPVIDCIGVGRKL